MPWMKISLNYQDKTAADEAVKALMQKVEGSCLSAGAPKDATVYRGRLPAVGQVFYFSPAAASAAASVMKEYGAKVCEHPPNIGGLTKIPI